MRNGWISISNRLDRIENEIRLLLDTQRKKITISGNLPSVTSSEVNEFVSNRTRSSSAPSKHICSKSECSDCNRGRCLSLKRTKSSFTTCSCPCSQDRCPKKRNKCLESVPICPCPPTCDPFECSNHEEGSCCNHEEPNDLCSSTCRLRYMEQKLKEESKRNDCLEKEIIKLRELIKELNKNQETASEICKKWKEKYKVLKKDQSHVGDDVRKRQLCTLEEEKSQALITIRNYEKQISCHKMIADKYDKLLKIVTEKNCTIGDLEQQVRERDNENKMIYTKCRDLENDLTIANEKYNQLRKTNEHLAAEVINKCKCFEASNSVTETELKKYRMEVEKAKEEVIRLQDQLNHARCQLGEDLNRVTLLETELRGAKKRDKCAKKIIATLEIKLETMETDYGKLKITCQNKLLKMEVENEKLKKRCEHLADELNDLNVKSTTRVKSLESEMESFKSCSCLKEQELIAEKDELRNLIQELSDVVARQKERINDLISLKNQQNSIIAVQNSSLSSKESELRTHEVEAVKVKTQYADLERHIRSLKDSLKTDSLIGNATLENEINALRKLLDEQKDKLKIKDKMLDDQTNTIMQLRRKIGEKEDTVASLYRELNGERKEKADLEKRLTKSESEKDAINMNLVNAKKECQMQCSLISNLEKKFKLKCQEWRLQSDLYFKEKENALNAARFATQQLNSSMKEFQDQCHSHNKLRVTLTHLLREKDVKLKSAIAEISSLTLDPEVLAITDDVDPDGNRSDRMESEISKDQTWKSTIEKSEKHKVDDRNPFSCLLKQPQPKASTVKKDKCCGVAMEYEQQYYKQVKDTINKIFDDAAVSSDSDHLNKVEYISDTLSDCSCLYSNPDFVCSTECSRYSNRTKTDSKKT
ncbi:PREDICTED: MAR-binding filament-like protein 1 [Nicrophorus vespilloides]|uniref:MAR-binding filament-like protein 1 n=1 Tax=Nicrophorus vespilloides TaxID=110193 RepID=A0ABM1MDL0_NICVS|nr:PREDICTED: MAR-binding filament-like protein 1 [Nicrophorus vespilloides]